MSPAIMTTVSKADEAEGTAKASKNKKAGSDPPDRKSRRATELQPYLEQQFRIAKLIDSANKEDPKLKEKLNKIVEATQKSPDEAFIALHDCDYDVNLAVNKLLEGENTEWLILSKKKKSKTPEAKEAKEKVAPETCNLPEDRVEDEVPSKPSIGRGDNSFRGRGRGSRGRGANRVLPREPQGSPMRRVFTNSRYEARTLEILEAARTERARTAAIRPVDTWDPNRPVSTLLTRGSHNDFEDEYTGPISRGLVFTSSTLGRRTWDTERNEPKRTALGKMSSQSLIDIRDKKSPDVEIPKADQQDQVPKETPNDNPLPLEKEEPKEIKEEAPKPNLGARAPPLNASVVKAPPLPEKKRVRRPRSSSIPPSSKPSSSSRIPSIPVEMPPDNDGSAELLDITFWAVDLEDNNYESLTKSDSSSELLYCHSKPPVQLKPGLQKSKEKSVENLRFVKDLKYENSFYDTSMPPPCPKASHKTKSLHHVSLIDTSSISGMSPTTAQIPFVASSGVHQPMSYRNLYSQSTQPQPMPCQNVLSGSTYTSSPPYSSGLSSPSYSMPYQSYSSMVQGHKLSASSSFQNDLDGIVTGNNVVSFAGGVTSTSYSLPNANPSSNTTTQAPSDNMSNMQALVGPQLILGQGGVTYYQTPLYIQDLQVQMQRPPPHMAGAYYDMGYPASPPRGDANFPPIHHQVSHPDQLHHHPMMYGDSSPSGHHYPNICMSNGSGSAPSPDSNQARTSKPPPFPMPPVNQSSYYQAGKPSSSQQRNY